MNTSPLLYLLPGELGSIEFSASVLEHFEKHKQHSWYSCEAGGQLFASSVGGQIAKVLDVTGPRRTDRRSLFGYVPDRSAERIEIADRYAHGLHFIGDWHTHRQPIPFPSSTDNRNMRDLVRLSSHDLAGFIMVIVGQAEFPEGLHVSFHTKTTSTILVATDSFDVTQGKI